MKQSNFVIAENRTLAKDVRIMTLQGDIEAPVVPGQFVEVRLGDFFLRRPFSVFDQQEDRLSIVYKVTGKGTDAMSHLKPGTELDLLVGLGNGFDLSKSGDTPLLVGGGIGAAALYLLCRQLIAAGRRVTVILGFNSAAEDYCCQQFLALGADVRLTSMDGSCGIRGVVTDALDTGNTHSYLYCCGPMAMMRAVATYSPLPAEFCLEERMGCGFGACLGCSIETKDGPRRVCKDGPVFYKEAILW